MTILQGKEEEEMREARNNIVQCDGSDSNSAIELYHFPFLKNAVLEYISSLFHKYLNGGDIDHVSSIVNSLFKELKILEKLIEVQTEAELHFDYILNKADLKQLEQLKSVTWDGDLIGKTSRNNLVRMGFAERLEGWNFITKEGIRALISYKRMKK